MTGEKGKIAGKQVGEYFEKEEILSAIAKAQSLEEVKDIIAKLSVVEASPIFCAEWVPDRDTVYCSNCKFGVFLNATYFLNGDCISSIFNPQPLPMCPHCGATMINTEDFKNAFFER